jgi:hypothetical protein
VFSRFEKGKPETGGDSFAVKNLAVYPEGNPSGEKPDQRGLYADHPGRVLNAGGAFATIDQKHATEALQENADRVSPKMKKRIRRPDFQQEIGNLFATTAN